METAPAWRVFQDRGLKPRGDNWDAVCPAHKDERKSLSVQLTEDGRVLLRCFAGCPTVTIVESIGLKMFDLYPPEQKTKREEKPFNVIKEYIYTDEKGEPLYKVQRGEPKAFRQLRKTADGWEYRLGDVTRVLYHLPRLLSNTRPVCFVEGEKDVESLEALGFIATTCNGGAGGWRPEMAEPLRNRQVIIFPDNDAPGRELAWTVKSYVASSMIVKVPLDAPKSDVSDWIAAGATAKDIRAAVLRQAEANVAGAMDMFLAVGGKRP